MSTFLRFIVCVLLIACKSNVKNQQGESAEAVVLPPNAVPMIINCGRILVPFTINDSILATLLFDTGAASSISLEKDFALKHAINFDKQSLEKAVDLNTITCTRVLSPLTVALGNVPLEYQKVFVCNPIIGIGDIDGMIAPNFNVDKRIWELNFEHNYFSIIDKDTIPPNSLVFPFSFNDKAGRIILVELPITLIGQKDTLVLHFRYILDTGTPMSVAFVRDNPSLQNFIEKQVCVENHFVVDNITVADSVTINYGRFVIAKNNPPQFIPKDVIGTLGVDFLKYFNVFLDLKNQQLFLQKHYKPIENFQYSNIGCDLKRNNEKLMVSMVFKESPAAIAGVQKGDEIITINGKKTAMMNDDDIIDLYKIKGKSVVRMIINRNGKELSLSFEAYEHPLNFYNH